MFAATGRRLAVRNAQARVRAAANGTIVGNDADGATAYLLRN